MWRWLAAVRITASPGWSRLISAGLHGEIRLGAWVGNQRSRAATLTPERVEENASAGARTRSGLGRRPPPVSPRKTRENLAPPSHAPGADVVACLIDVGLAGLDVADQFHQRAVWGGRCPRPRRACRPQRPGKHRGTLRRAGGRSTSTQGSSTAASHTSEAARSGSTRWRDRGSESSWSGGH